MITAIRYKGDRAKVTENGEDLMILASSSNLPVELADVDNELNITSDFEEGEIETQAVKKIKFNKNSCVMMNGDVNFIFASSQRENREFIIKENHTLIHAWKSGDNVKDKAFEQIKNNKVESVDVYVKNAEGKDNRVSNMGEIVAVSINLNNA
ncbi:hypothetical protein EIG99_11575 [Staphylococcus condimenti]|uniref:Uncharacterized protein n=1 Tax=Staphylococcus condimenti TaxID=70255 RepID=A0A4Q7CRG4_9STAP|nr:hypothetical protein [Staphylococcus condimenti]RZI00421.1 hypothetical protein EIG99_11575 [Staphylococcus condimenti]RZI03196.1 hypothetical protein EIG98_07205 [Staphylococcus condimenti]